MRRASALALLLAACGGDGGGARARCDRALDRAREMNPAEVSVYVAHECADLYTGACRDLLRHIEDLPVLERLDRLAGACRDQRPAHPFHALLAVQPKGRQDRADAAPRTPRVVVHEDFAVVELSPQNRRVDTTCDALAAELADTPRPVIEVQAAPDVDYARVIATLDCLDQQGFDSVGIVP